MPSHSHAETQKPTRRSFLRELDLLSDLFWEARSRTEEDVDLGSRTEMKIENMRLKLLIKRWAHYTKTPSTTFHLNWPTSQPTQWPSHVSHTTQCLHKKGPACLLHDAHMYTPCSCGPTWGHRPGPVDGGRREGDAETWRRKVQRETLWTMDLERSKW